MTTHSRYWRVLVAAAITVAALHWVGMSGSLLGGESSRTVERVGGCPNVQCISPTSGTCKYEEDFGCCQNGGCVSYLCDLVPEPPC